MKQLFFIIATIFLANNSFSQVLTGKLPGIGIQDSTNKNLRSLSMFNILNKESKVNKESREKIAVFINHKQSSLMEIQRMNPQFLNTVHVEKTDTIINGKN